MMAGREFLETKTKISHKLIESRVKDDGDYDYIYDNAVHNTLKKYFKWADESNVKISFYKDYTDDPMGYGILLNINANFTNSEDYALFKLTFGTEPLTEIKTNPDMESWFE